MGHVDTVRATRLSCSTMCYINTRCHGFTHSKGYTCDVFDYYPLPGDHVIVEEYYQIF